MRTTHALLPVSLDCSFFIKLSKIYGRYIHTSIKKSPTIVAIERLNRAADNNSSNRKVKQSRGQHTVLFTASDYQFVSFIRKQGNAM
jgi:hypothetical protein